MTRVSSATRGLAGSVGCSGRLRCLCDEVPWENVVSISKRTLRSTLWIIIHSQYWGSLWTVLIKQLPETENILPWHECGLHRRGEAKASCPIQFSAVTQSSFLTKHNLHKDPIRLGADGPDSLMQMKYLLRPHYVFSTELAFSLFTIFGWDNYGLYPLSTKCSQSLAMKKTWPRLSDILKLSSSWVTSTYLPPCQAHAVPLVEQLQRGSLRFCTINKGL